AVHGLKTIDLRDIVPSSTSLPALSVAGDGLSWPGPESSAREFLERLKAEIESRGGVWVRLADYPFPYQSAICLGIEHLSEELAGFAAIAATLPGKATHFVSSRLRPDRLAFLSQVGSVDLGWEILPEDCERSARRTLSHWTTRMQRFGAAELRPAG